MKLALALALCPAVAAVRLAKVDPSDYTLAMQVRGRTRPSENPCRVMRTPPKMCDETPGWVPKHTAAAVISTFMEDIHWLNEMPWSDNLTVFVHNRSAKRTHAPKTAEVKLQENIWTAEESEETVEELNEKRSHPIQFVHIPNDGDEAAAYLKFIIERYDSLPDVSFFLQGHRCADHANFDMADALPDMRRCFMPSHGYKDLNGYNKVNSTTKCRPTKFIMENPIMGFHIEKFGDIWNKLFKKALTPNNTMPTQICWDAFAQFAVSRDTIRRHPVTFYKTLEKAVHSGITNMEFFWRAVFVPSAINWQELPKRDKFGRLIAKEREYKFSKEEEIENLRVVDEEDQIRARGKMQL